MKKIVLVIAVQIPVMMNANLNLLMNKLKIMYNNNLIALWILYLIYNVKRVSKDIITIIIYVYNVIIYVFNVQMSHVKLVNIWRIN